MEISEQCVVGLTWTMKDTLGDVLDVLEEPVEFLVGGDDLFGIVGVEPRMCDDRAGKAAARIHIGHPSRFRDLARAIERA